MSILNLKNIFSFVAITVFYTGCAQIDVAKNQSQFLEYDNTNHIVGNQNSAIKKLIFIEKINGKVNKKITFFIDKFPFEANFNLCLDKQNFKVVKSVSMNEHNEFVAIYEDTPIDCSGNIYLSLRNNNFIGSCNIKFLNGFNVEDFHGYDLLLKHTYRISSNFFTIENKSFEQDFIKKVIKEQYWYIEELKD